MRMVLLLVSWPSIAQGGSSHHVVLESDAKGEVFAARELSFDTEMFLMFWYVRTNDSAYFQSVVGTHLAHKSLHVQP
jgi:hypothetical protein